MLYGTLAAIEVGPSTILSWVNNKRNPQSINLYIIMNTTLIKRAAYNFYKMAHANFPMAGKVVDGLLVRDEVPNVSSISSSLNDYEILPGIREVNLSEFGSYSPNYYSAQEEKRTKLLAEQIKNSKEINPLIVVVDSKGPYILEGGHRFDALYEINAKSFPALVVIDKE
jgi:hypothetical protein